MELALIEQDVPGNLYVYIELQLCAMCIFFFYRHSWHFEFCY